MKCPQSNVLYRNTKDGMPINTVSGNSDKFDMLCEKDGNIFYQACGEKFSPTAQRTDSIKFLCGTFVCKNVTNGISYSGSREYDKYNCNAQHQCTNDIDEVGCDPDTEYYTCSSERTLQKRKVCDGHCDCALCSDESLCNGYMYGIWCKNKSGKNIYRQPRQFSCPKKVKNQGNCILKYNCSEVPSCPYINAPNKLKPLVNNTRCHQRVMCSNKQDQTNCSDERKTPLVCLVNNYTTYVSENVICNVNLTSYKASERTVWNVSVCDDGIDLACVSPSPICYTHKHNLCDGKHDCSDGSDERDCKNLMKQVCSRKMGYKLSPSHIPLQFVNDGVEDCVDGLDEKKDIWDTCQYKDLERIVVPGTECEDVYICRQEKPGFIELKELCDNIDTCGNENEVCKAAQNSLVVANTVQRYSNHFLVSFCLDGFHDNNIPLCKQTVFPSSNILGTLPNNIVLPVHPVSCKYFYGEAYVFLACSGKCTDAECPLKELLTYKSCPQQFKNRVYSLVNNAYLTFVKPSKSSFHVQNIFTCANHHCIPYQKVCDLVNDCGDGSDEADCINHFICNRNSSTYRQQYIPLSSVCNGVIDCLDLSDECNEFCKADLIERKVLKFSCFIIGVLAVTFNILIMKNNFLSLRHGDITPLCLLNKMLIILIGFGDLLVGVYLLVIAVVDQVKHTVFCTEQQDWRVSWHCSALGVISTVGSQLSLFSMTSLSLVRVYGIRLGLSAPTALRARHALMILLLMIFLLSISIAISIIPLLPSLKDWFINALYIPGIPLFLGLPSKPIVQKTALTYYGRTRSDIHLLSWDRIIDLVRNMFTKKTAKIQIKPLSFYGDSPVCLFKYFVKPNEPQRLFSWTILIVNFVSFSVITLAYVMINILTRNSTRTVAGKSETAQLSLQQRNKRLQRKISLIILTDFLCWVPFIFISFLHSIEVINATSWYGILSVVILPINSVINPFLYDDYIGKQAELFVRLVSQRTKKLSLKIYRSENDESKL